MPSNIIIKEDVARDIARIWHCQSDAEIQTIAENLSVRRFCKNETIYHENEQPTRLLYLVSGKVKIVKECTTGRPQIVRVVKVNYFMGYRAFFAHQNYTTSAMAFEDSHVAALPINVVVRMMEKSGGIARYFMFELAVMLGMTDWRIVSLTQKHIRGRLAETILYLKENYGTCDDNTLDIMMSREDIASMSNMSTSNAIRTLSAFAHEKLIRIEGKKIEILNEKELGKISNRG